MAPNPSTVAIHAAIDGNVRLLKKLARKMDLREAKDDHGGGLNLLHLAAFKGRLDVCRFLVEESGLDVNSVTNDGATPIASAAAAGKVSVLRYFLDHGGDPVMRDAMGTTPLHVAADGGQCEAVTLLLSRGVDVDPVTKRLATPLDLAAGKGHDQVVKVLLDHGADFNRVSHNIFTPLMKACYEGSLKCIKLLVEAGADVNFKSPYGPSPLLQAVIDGSTDIVKFLLEAGADPNISDEFGRNPIMRAACYGQRDLVEILFPHTEPITYVPNWSVDGLMTTAKSITFKAKEGCSTGKGVLAGAKLRGNEAFAKGDYLAATNLYEVAMQNDPLDATLYANSSLCWLRLGDGEQALSNAQKCKMMRPRWSKAWYREGAALGLLKNYNGAASMFMEALKLDPANDEIKTALREAIEAQRCAARSEEQNP
ncbi:unnamed protein product [Urochloa decumbens]|uniref:Uncharacterized protein n=1 Tax=Urochloa decumbens TaxID=240449 RepID=A0ABC8W9D7_9POAL